MDARAAEAAREAREVAEAAVQVDHEVAMAISHDEALASRLAG